MSCKVLIYTDSRGQHTPRGAPVHDVFAQRLAQTPGVEAEVVLCPMKWTTTIDFLEYLKDHPATNYDWVILYTGIVDWSPRPQPSALSDLYNNATPLNLGNGSLNTRDYSKKVVNYKKAAFDSIFGEHAMADHLAHDLGVEYEGKPTINLYSLEMARRSLLPKLAAIDNLIFINANRFVPGWEGDFTRGRPANIALTEKYSELFRDFLGSDKVIDLLQWSLEEVKNYTCDNIHLTRAGSDWIYTEICKRIGITVKVTPDVPSTDTLMVNHKGRAPVSPYGRTVEPPTILTDETRRKYLLAAGLQEGDRLATLIVGIRLQCPDDARTRNLLFLLSWIDRYYGDLFDVLLVEQGASSNFEFISAHLKRYVRYKFIYNPRAYNRGWGYNVAVRHFTRSKVVVLMDTDVLTGANFVQEIVDCSTGKYSVVSPYTNIYFTTESEATSVMARYGFENLRDEKRVRKPTTITGGIVIFRRDTYEHLAGFEQYTDYGGEDRALDVTVLNHCNEAGVRMAPHVYVHLAHPSAEIDESRLAEILAHLESNFGCTVDRTLSGGDFIHRNCSHATKQKTGENIERRRPSYGDIDLYKSGRALTINGCYDPKESLVMEKVIFPPDFSTLESYEEKELYKAPEHDAARLRTLYNAFKGKRCFIIGNGPSLNKHDLSLLEGEYVFAVNSFFYKTEETGFRPTFYVVEDNAVMKENIERIRAFDAPFKFFPTIYKNLHPEGDNVYFFKMNRGFYEKSSPNYCVPRFSPDASKVLYCGQSVTYINLQLAYFLGFTEVYLLGMDFDYVIPPEHQRRGDLILSTTDDPNHFHKDYFGKGKTWKDPKLDRVGMNYRQARLSFDAVGRKIYNATIGGRLEIFPRVDYEALLRDPLTGGKRQVALPSLPIVSQGEGAEEKTFTLGDAPSLQLVGHLSALAPDNSQAVCGEPLPGTAEVAGKISVIVPVYNVQDYLEQCLESLVAQKDDSYEVVIVDDGSTDGSAEIIQRFCKNNDHFRVYRQPNAGLGGARNSGLRLSRGEFVTFVDSDDYVSKDYLATLRSEQVRGNHDVVSAQFIRTTDNGTVLEKQIPRTQEVPPSLGNLRPFQLVLGAFRPSISCARLYRRRLLTANGLTFRSRMPHEDLCFTYKALYFSSSSGEVGKETYYYRQREDSLSKAITTAHVDALFEQWRDTEEFLNSIGASDFDRLLADRRTLILAEGIASRCESVRGAVENYFNVRIASEVSRLQAALSRLRAAEIGDKYNPRKIEAVIQRIAALPLPQSQSTMAELIVNPAELVFPHDSLDLRLYQQREVVEMSDPSAEIQQLHNKFKGKRCFIIGNGPSLNRHDLSLLEGEFVFAVNSFYYKTDETGFKPTFFVVEDNMVMQENIERIKAYDVPYKFFPTDYKRLHPAGENVFFFRMNQGFYQKSSPYYCVPRFSTDASSMLYCGQSVTYINLQLAFFMGFTEVYLIGMDFDYVIPKEHHRKGNHILSTTDDPNHFHKDYFGKGKTWKDPKLDRVAMNYRQAKLAFEAVGRRVYNATAGGKLEIFPRVDYERLLRDPTSGKRREKPVMPMPYTPGEEGDRTTGQRAQVPAAVSPAPPKEPSVDASFQATTVRASDTPPAQRATKARTAAELRAARWAKLKRDPHAFFKDSHVSVLRPLSVLFKPATRKKWEVDAEARARAATKRRLGFLPATRNLVAAERAASEMERRAVEVTLRQEIATAKREIRATETALRGELRSLRETLSKHSNLVQEEGRALLRGEIEAVKAANAALGVDLRGELAKAADRAEQAISGSAEIAHQLAEAISARASRDIEWGNEIEAARQSSNKAMHQVALLDEQINERLVSLAAELETTREDLRRMAHEAAKNSTRVAKDVLLAEATERVDALDASIRAELATALEAMANVDASLRTDLESMQCDLEAVAKQTVGPELARRLEAVSVENAALRADIENLQHSFEDVAKQAVAPELAAIKAAQQKDKKLSNYSNGALVRVHDRYFSEADLEHIRKHWLRLLGLEIPPRQLSYMAHQICLAEERCEGRMATTIQAAMLRTLALLSMQAKQVELLEIGTLFGIAAGTLYRAGVRAGRDMRMTLIDPLDGYYGQNLKDQSTGVPVTRETLTHNLRVLGVPDEHYRVIQHLSSDPAAFDAAADRRYDFVLVDGDHSIEGVAADFDIYGSLVKPGGVLVFDDYDTIDWPAIKPFVDEHVRSNGEWLWIGGEWRTAIFRRKRGKAADVRALSSPAATEVQGG